MAAPKPRTVGERIHVLRDRLDNVGYRYDDAISDTAARRELNHELEAIADEVRSIPRGRGFR